MALAIDTSTPAMASSTQITPPAVLTTAAFSPPAGSFLLALLGRDTPNAGGNATNTVSGAGLTWTLAGRKTDYASATGVVAGGTNQPGSVEVWWAYTASALTNVTVSATANDTTSTGGTDGALSHSPTMVMV